MLINPIIKKFSGFYFIIPIIPEPGPAFDLYFKLFAERDLRTKEYVQNENIEEKEALCI